MSQTVHLQELHFQEMEMVFLWMWLVNRMLPSSVTVRCEGEVLKLPIKRLSRVSMYVWLIMWLSSHVWKVGPSPEGSKCSPEWQNCPMPFAVVLCRSQHEVTAILYLLYLLYIRYTDSDTVPTLCGTGQSNEEDAIHRMVAHDLRSTWS